jgi:hypothetical protein
MLFLSSYGCANIVPPSGGEKDETPPVLLSISPADSSLNLRPKLIELRFNKFMEVKELEKNMRLSPLIPITPTVTSYAKRVEITLADSLLLPNTTYRIDLGNALVDNREATPYKDFVFTFSTGSYFDSLELRGQAFDAASGLPDSAVLVVLYPESESDSAVFKTKPLYTVLSDARGNFVFKSLPAQQFSMYTISDANNNLIYDRGEEKIGFLGSRVAPGLGTDTSYIFYLFKENLVVAASDSLPEVDTSGSVAAGGLRGRSKRASASNTKSAGYYVNVDTSDRSKRTQELTRDIEVELFTELSELDSAKVYLSYESGNIEVEAVQRLKVDSGKMFISTQWQPDKLYTLRLVKGWAKDSSGTELAPGKYFFRTKREDDYGKIKVHIHAAYYGPQFVLQLFNDDKSFYQKPVTDSIVTIPLLQPGAYKLRIIVDSNQNGVWDAGVYLEGKQPEKVIPYLNTIQLKAGWENELDFQPPAPAPAPKEEVPATPVAAPEEEK